MAQLSVTRDIPNLLEALFGVGAVTIPVLGSLRGTVTVTTPSNAAANTVAVVTGTLTGVKVGDIVLAFPTTALPAGQVFTGAYVTAADTITFVTNSTAAVTGASRVFNVITLALS